MTKTPRLFFYSSFPMPSVPFTTDDKAFISAPPSLTDRPDTTQNAGSKTSRPSLRPWNWVGRGSTPRTRSSSTLPATGRPRSRSREIAWREGFRSTTWPSRHGSTTWSSPGTGVPKKSGRVRSDIRSQAKVNDGNHPRRQQGRTDRRRYAGYRLCGGLKAAGRRAVRRCAPTPARGSSDWPGPSGCGGGCRTSPSAPSSGGRTRSCRRWPSRVPRPRR